MKDTIITFNHETNELIFLLENGTYHLSLGKLQKGSNNISIKTLNKSESYKLIKSLINNINEI